MNGLVEVESGTETFQRIGSLARSTEWGCVRSRLGGPIDPGAVTPHVDYQTKSPTSLRREMVSIEAAVCADGPVFQLAIDVYSAHGKSRRKLVMVMRRKLQQCFAS